MESNGQDLAWLESSALVVADSCDRGGAGHRSTAPAHFDLQRCSKLDARVWTQSSAPDVYCDQVWTMPVGGGMPRVLACDVGNSRLKPPMIFANDEVVHWIGSDVRVLDAQGL